MNLLKVAPNLENEIIDTLCDFFWDQHMEDMTVAVDKRGHLVVKDDEGNKWKDAEVYDFVLNECLAFEKDGSLSDGLAAAEPYVEKLKEHAKLYGVEITSFVQKFVFDDELYFGQDEACETVNGYLWAVDSFVSRLRDAVKDKHSADELKTFNNINFYAVYNVWSCTVKVECTYDYVHKGFGSWVNKMGVFELPMTDNERADLIDVMEVYCQKLHGKSCTEMLNECRVEDGLTPISTLADDLAKKPSLCDSIEKAAAQSGAGKAVDRSEQAPEQDR